MTPNLLPLVVAFALVALASNDIGQWFSRYKLPLITGFLFTGALAGPYALDLLTKDMTAGLGFVDQISLAIIAFAAGSELYLKEIRSRLRSILTTAAALVVCTFCLGTLGVFLLADFVPFLADQSGSARFAVAILGGAILVARSPSSAIAIVNELRARGPFTQTTLGVTVLIDVAVIVLFAVSFTVADSLLFGHGFDVVALGVLVLALLVSIGLGCGVGWLLSRMFSQVSAPILRRAAVLLVGWGVFLGSAALRDFARGSLGLTLHLEPMLICMVTAFFVTNWTDARAELARELRAIAPPVFVAFFTLTGASLELDVIARTWPFALALVGVRLMGIALGSWSGGRLAGEPERFNRIAWMSYITQAGVALGLAKGVAVAFPDWGPAFATTLIGLIVFNQIIGPPFFKWALYRVGEQRTQAEPTPFDGVRDALIFGVEGQSLALARVLRKHGWQVKLATMESKKTRQVGDTGITVHPIEHLDLETLRRLEAERADAIVALLTDPENMQVCELAFENYGTRVLIVRLNELHNAEAFRKLGVLVVNPATAMVGLLDRAVRSPATASLLLGMETETDMVDVQVGNPDVAGLQVRQLRLPLDVAVHYVYRGGYSVPSKGSTVLELGDRVTVSGPRAEVEKAVSKLEA